MLGVALALLSSAAWGVADFLGGVMTRSVPAISVLLVSQPVGGLLALIVALLAGGDGLSTEDFLIVMAGGAAGVGALAAFYTAMAIGSVSVAATIGTLALLVPVLAGLARGETPEPVQAAGAAVAVAGVVLVARTPEEQGGTNRTSAGLALLAALGFGVLLLILDHGAAQDPLWTIVAGRAGGVATLLVAAAVVRPRMPAPRKQVVAALLAIALCEILANGLFAVATTKGLLPLVAVAGSLYSAATVLLARVFLAERLAGPQQAGLGLAFSGVVLMAAGA